MKIKKFNTIVAAMVVAGGLFVSSTIPTLTRAVTWPFASITPIATDSIDSAIDPQAASEEFSAIDKNVTEIPWEGYLGGMPGKATLKKWTVGNRTYYQMSGPINPAYRNQGTGDNAFKNWAQYPAYEVFFPRGDKTYDQWIINPNQSVVLHYDSQMKLSEAGGESPLPSSRVRTLIDGDQIIITFWCANGDTPSNMVFNYNHGDGKGGGTLGWATTGRTPNGQGPSHHRSDWWTYR